MERDGSPSGLWARAKHLSMRSSSHANSCPAGKSLTTRNRLSSVSYVNCFLPWPMQPKLFRRSKCVPNAAKRLLAKASCKKAPGKARIMPSKAGATTASSGRRGKTRKGQLAREELRTPAVTILPSTFAKKAWVNAGLSIYVCTVR